MDVQQFLSTIAVKYPLIGAVLMVLGALVVLGQTYVALTPSKDDDAKLAKLYTVPVLGVVLKALAAFAPIQKAPKVVEAEKAAEAAAQAAAPAVAPATEEPKA